jgi:ATP phosphoribosyltransferase
MLNAPESQLAAIEELVRPRMPSILPLAEPGMVAVHVLVPSAAICGCCPRWRRRARVVDPDRAGRADVVAEP